MGWFGNQAEKAVEGKIYAEGGYPALIKYKVGEREREHVR